MKRIASLLLAAVLGMVPASCGCGGHPLCPIGIALIINVTAGPAGGPVNGAVVHVSGPYVTTVPCNTTCYVPGSAGTYDLDVEAPGFQTTHRTVTVHGTSGGECSCDTTNTEQLTVALVASP